MIKLTHSGNLPENNISKNSIPNNFNSQFIRKLSGLNKNAEEYITAIEKSQDLKIKESVYRYYDNLKSKIEKAENAFKKGINDKCALYINEAETKSEEMFRFLEKGFPEKIPMVNEKEDLFEITHNFYEIFIKNRKGILFFNLKDKITDFEPADSPIHCRLVYQINNKRIEAEKLEIENIEVLSEDYNYKISINIVCENLKIINTIFIPSYQPFFSEEIYLENTENSQIEVLEFNYGLSKMAGHIEKLNLLSLDGWKFYSCNKKGIDREFNIKEIIISDEINTPSENGALIFTDEVRGLLISRFPGNRFNNLVLRKKIHRNILYPVYGGVYFKKNQNGKITIAPERIQDFGRTTYTFYNGDTNSGLKQYNRILKLSGFK